MALLARTASSAAASSSGRCPVSPCLQPSRHRVVAAMMPPGSPMPEVNNDPEGLFKGLPMREGLIARRQMQRKVEVDKEFAKAMASAGDELRKEQLLRRETRRPPATHEEMIEYFLNTMAEDLEFEVARYRPRMTPDFFVYLDNILGAERFSAKPDEERLAELDLLRKYLAEAAEAVDKCVAATSSASERVKKLLMAKDKKAMILEMAAANEIDQALMDLLQQNIDQAKAAEQEEPAKFMEKVKLACAKYMISTQQAALPQVPDQLGSRAAGIPLLGQAQPAEPPASGGDAAPAAPAPPPAQKPARKTRGGIILAPGQEPTPAGKLIY